MRRSPGLHSAFRNLKAFRNLVEFLENVLDFHVLTHSVSHALTEILFIFFLNDENDLFKARPVRVVHGKVNDLVALFVHRIDLLESAVAASHTRCQNYKYRFVHFFFPFCVFFTRCQGREANILKNVKLFVKSAGLLHFTLLFYLETRTSRNCHLLYRAVEMLSQVFLPFWPRPKAAFGIPRRVFFASILPQTARSGNFPINAFFGTFVRQTKTARTFC